jgi:hypothetical protein
MADASNMERDTLLIVKGIPPFEHATKPRFECSATVKFNLIFLRVALVGAALASKRAHGRPQTLTSQNRLHTRQFSFATPSAIGPPHEPAGTTE